MDVRAYTDNHSNVRELNPCSDLLHDQTFRASRSQGRTESQPQTENLKEERTVSDDRIPLPFHHQESLQPLPYLS